MCAHRVLYRYYAQAGLPQQPDYLGKRINDPGGVS
jgi:hypothetical protein